jgi:hypothetical protein
VTIPYTSVGECKASGLARLRPAPFLLAAVPAPLQKIGSNLVFLREVSRFREVGALQQLSYMIYVLLHWAGTQSELKSISKPLGVVVR